MADDWIKMRTDLYRNPRVCVIADLLIGGSNETVTERNGAVTPRNVMRNAVVGALVTVWGVARVRGMQVGEDLKIDGVKIGVIDDIVDIIGFGNAMAESGWLVEDAEGLVFPRFFCEFNEPYQSRRQAKTNAERQREYRLKQTVTNRNEKVTSRNEKVTKSNAKRERERESKRENNKSSPESAETGGSVPDQLVTSEAVLLTFPTAGSPSEWNLYPSQADEWQRLFPSVDVLGECRKALAWVKANRSKTAKGMPKFLVGWFGRSNDRGGKPAQPTFRGKAEQIEDYNARMMLDAFGGQS